MGLRECYFLCGELATAEVQSVLEGENGISAELALRLARCLGSSADFWLGLQKEYDLQTAQDALSEKIEAEVTRLIPPRAA